MPLICFSCVESAACSKTVSANECPQKVAIFMTGSSGSVVLPAQIIQGSRPEQNGPLPEISCSENVVFVRASKILMRLEK